MEIGKFHKLKILRETSVGAYLGDNSDEDVLLPYKYCPERFNIGDELDVFVYRDYAERKIATNLIPKIFMHEFALLKVTDVNDYGAFLDWGLEKGLMVPFSEQRDKMLLDRSYVVYMDVDLKTDRLFASNKIEKILQNKELSVKQGDEVEVLVFRKTDLGYSVIVNNQHKGLIYENEVFEKLNIGDKRKAYVKVIRDENKLDISLQALGYLKYNDANADLVYKKLLESNGKMMITDKSTPEEIYTEFSISKKAFKKALGALYRQRKINIQADCIELTN